MLTPSTTRTLVIALAGLLTALGASAFAPSQGSIPFPEGYRHWTHVKSSLVGPQAPGLGRNAGYHHFYANDKAMEGYRTGTFPDGAILIDDGLEAIERDGLSTEGPRRRVAVMVKDSRQFGDSQPWGFETFPGDSRDGALSAAQKGACLACHQRAGASVVYSRFRK